MKLKVPKGYRSKNVEDRRGEIKRADITKGDNLYKLNRAGNRIEENLEKMDTKARKNVLTERTDANLRYATGFGPRPRKKR